MLPQLGVEILARRLLLLILISFPVVSWHQSQVLLEIAQRGGEVLQVVRQKAAIAQLRNG